MRTKTMSGKPSGPLWLVVDDDPDVLKSITYILRSIPGAEVVACDGPFQALKVLSTAPGSVELLVTDFNMPGLNGIQLAQLVRADFPQVQILLTSGGTVQARDALSAGVDAFLSKPFSAKELLAAVFGLINREELPRQQLQSCES